MSPRLPELASDASPGFVDPGSCKAWLEHLPLANLATAQQELLAELEELNRFPTAAANRLQIMETLREAVNFVQIEQAKRFSNRALPMSEGESAVFDDTIELWEQMRLGYLRCLEAGALGDAAVRSQAALVCQRLLAYCGLKMFHHFRAYREVPGHEWQALHEAYAQAEALQVAEEPVKDFLNRDVHDTSPRIAYARAVLMGMCNPNELAQRQLTFVAFLLERWAVKLEVSHRPVDEGEGVPPLVADLASDRCPERISSYGDAGEARFLDARKLAKSLRNRVGLLRKGESPAKLALGEDCVQPACEQLLVFLYRQWCQARPGRALERRSSAERAQVCNDLGAIHYYVSGRVFRQPGEAKELTQKERTELATFGRVSTRDEEDYSDAQGFALEEWTLEDETAQGLRIARPADAPGRRFLHGQLVAVKPADAKSFLLGQVRWLQWAENGDLRAGVRLLPGIPAGAAVRATGLNVQDEKYRQAMILGALAKLNVPRTLVLPPAWYKPKRVLDLFLEAPMRVRLLELIERGTDFERVTFEEVRG